MTIDIRVLRYCEAIARHSSFTKAAKELNIAQPALSIAIRKLETELGVTLFTREARRVVATPEARLLLKRAARVFEEINFARQELQAAAELRFGEVRVGMPPMFGLLYFPRMIRDFHKAYPALTITATEGSADEIEALLESGAIDLGMLESRRVRQGWQHAEVGQDETILCVRRDHPLASRANVSAKDLGNLPMVVFDSNFLQRNVLDKLCNKAGVGFHLVMQSNFVPLIQQAVVDGLGAATLLRSLAEEDPRVAAVSFSPPQIFRFSLCWRDAHALSKPNRAFVEFALQRYGSGGK